MLFLEYKRTTNYSMPIQLHVFLLIHALNPPPQDAPMKGAKFAQAKSSDRP